MQYIKKVYEFEESNQDMGEFGKLSKVPTFLAKLLIKSKVKDIRAAMGGDSKDISLRFISVEDKIIKGYKSDLRIRIYKPEGDALRPLMMFYHGGGWIGGTLDAVDDYCKAVADRADCVVISVDYHLAPEAKFPEGLEDSYNALLWAVDHSDMLNVDVTKVSVSGDSAGGNFAAVLSIMAKTRKQLKIDKQILLYPATDLSSNLTETNNKRDAFGEAILELYTKSKKDYKNPYVSPILCEDLSQLPKALIAIGELDTLKDSSYKYAEALDRSGNDVTFILFTNTRHAFIDNTGNCKQAADLIDEVTSFIKS